MAEQKTEKIEREYIIPLRREWRKASYYKRSSKAVKAIKEFIAKHMKVKDRDVNKVKLDSYLNNDIWFRGSKKPPAKVKVKATKEGDIVSVTFAEIPQFVKFLKLKHSKKHKKSDKKPEGKEEVKKEEKTEEQKKDEQEKEKATENQNMKLAEQQAKTQKHLTQKKPESFHRMALKK